jgi:histidine ammonia-lyase
MNENLSVIVGVELLCAAQGVEFRAPLTTSPVLRRLLATVREVIPPLGEDRYMADDLARAAALVREGRVAAVCGIRDLLGARA